VKSESNIQPKESDSLMESYAQANLECIDNAPCIDCSLEEIPNAKSRRKSRCSINSQLMNGSNRDDGEDVEIADNRHNDAIDQNYVEVT
jgi:hypothetical protein